MISKNINQLKIIQKYYQKPLNLQQQVHNQFSTIKVDKKSQKPTGKAIFNSPYYPLKRINFENQDYEKIYEARDFIQPDPLKAKIAAVYWIPLGLYATNYFFFLNLQNFVHHFAMLGLGLFACLKTFNQLKMLNQRIAEVWIHKSGQEFLLTQRFNNFNQSFSDEVEISHSKISEIDRLSFKFTLDDVLQVNLVNQKLYDTGYLKKEKDDDLNDESEQKKKQNKQTQNNNGKFLIQPEMQQDTVSLIIKKQNYTEPIKFYIDIDKNELKSYNDYLIAFGMKQRLILSSQQQQQKQQNQKQQQEEQKGSE
ncbi:hypothetical protein PPERSA_04807 [Pseudocohnilembus persalinus]|uniref:Transmembrane protein n=1 Tax=Pseudocohnilembus persalinus TaxID=266149 RepID=A0A0V0QL89_PSEPJ|nr:hypothetical protein PPERSA_04807 [Pseudocohnilembus persalinus]|eukprot:KRX03012.1 hypothetical protein PPERSA_04807 [Pseudocohnilembus persalinus]